MSFVVMIETDPMFNDLSALVRSKGEIPLWANQVGSLIIAAMDELCYGRMGEVDAIVRSVALEADTRQLVGARIKELVFNQLSYLVSHSIDLTGLDYSSDANGRIVITPRKSIPVSLLDLIAPQEHFDDHWFSERERKRYGFH
jgi:hypothetical protein